MTEQDVLQHFGILGMKWGRSKGASYYEGKKSKALAKNEKYSAKISKLDTKAAKVFSKAYKKDAKLRLKTIDTLSSEITPNKIKKLKSATLKLKKVYKKYNQLTKKSAKYRLKVEKNKWFIKLMDQQIQTIPQKTIDLGKQLVNSAIN